MLCFFSGHLFLLSTGLHHANEDIVVLFGHVLVHLSLWNPGKIVIVMCFGNIVGHIWQTTIVMRQVEVGPHTFESCVDGVLLLCLSEMSERVHVWQCSNESDFELITADLEEKILFGSSESCSPFHGRSWETPLTRVHVPEDHIGSILCRIMHSLSVLALWID